MEKPEESSSNAKHRVRACDACRTLKTRCVPSTGSAESSCSRCVRLSLNCKFTPRTRKKQRKRTDARVTLLEKELENLRSTLTVHNEPSRQPPQHHSPMPDNSQATLPNGNIAVPPSRCQPPMLPDAPEGVDFLERGPVSVNDAYNLVQVYINDCTPLYPVVQIDPFISIHDLRESRPLVFQAVQGAAAMKQNPLLATALQSEMTKIYARSILSDESHSLDLVQAILVSVSWYLPPRNSSHKRKFYELAHLAISTALEMGLDSSDKLRTAEEIDSPFSPEHERARAFVGCYMLSQGMSMTLRRPSMLRSSSGLLACIERIDTSPAKTPLDAILVEKAKLFQIVESISNDLRYSDPKRKFDLSQGDIVSKIQDFRQRLLQWRDNAALVSRHDALTIFYHYTMVYLYEIVLYPEHEPSDFVAPFQLSKVGLTKRASSMSSPRASAHLAHLIDSAQSFLNTFVSLTTDTLRVLPVSNYFRLVYVAFTITKLAMSHYDAESKLGTMLNVQHLKTDYYRTAILKQLDHAAERGCYPAPKIFLEQLGDLGRHWVAYAASMSTSSPTSRTPASSGMSQINSNDHDANDAVQDNTSTSGASAMPVENDVSGQSIDEHMPEQHASWPASSAVSHLGFFSAVPELGPEFDIWTAEDLSSWGQFLAGQEVGGFDMQHSHQGFPP